MSSPKKRIIYFFDIENESKALLTQYNGYYRVYTTIDERELFFNNQTTAIKYLLDKNYLIEILFN
jgi:hypothetical protein